MKQFVIVRSNRLQHENLLPCRMGVLYLFKMSENDSCFHRLTSVSYLSSVFLILNKMCDSIPNALKIINDGVREYNQKLRDHEKLDLTQALFVSRIIPPDRHVVLVACNPKR